jgi:uncharacterized FlgJ-related protein
MYKLICIISLTVSLNVKGNHQVKDCLDNFPSIIYKDIAYAQFVLETGHFKSRRFKEDNNLGGIKFKGAKLAIGHRGEYAIYANLEDCMQEYARIQARLINITNTLSRKDYFNKVLPKYAVDKNYPRLIRKLCKLYKMPMKS